MHVVVAVLLDRLTRDQVRASLRPHVQVQVYSSRWRALAALRRLPAVALITDVAADPALSTDTFLRLVHQRCPTLPVVAAVHLTSANLRALLQIAPIGVDGVIVAGVDSPWSVVQSVLGSPAIDTSIETVLAALRPRVQERAWPFVTSLVRTSTTPATVNDWSSNLGFNRTTLLRKLDCLGLPAPSATLTLTRLLIAVQLLGVHRWTVEKAAGALHYSSGSALRKSLRLHTGICPHQTRAVEGFDRAMSALVAKLIPTVERLA
jgi:AraC-like DNA-binding protein